MTFSSERRNGSNLEPESGGPRGRIVGRIEFPYSTDTSSDEYLTAQLRARTGTVQTHRYVDTDAAFSVALWAHLIGSRVEKLDLRFASSDDAVKLGTVGLDVSAGFKGLKTSCFEELAKFLPADERAALVGLVEHITLQDRGKLRGLAGHLNVTTLARQISVLKIGGSSDFEICLWAENYLHAILGQELDAVRARGIINEAPRFGPNNKIILLEQAGRSAVFLACQRSDVDVVVYHDLDRIGAIRADHVECLALNALLEGKLPVGEGGRGFFFHEDGFCVMWGSKKAPRKDPCPITARELAEIVSKELCAIADGAKTYSPK